MTCHEARLSLGVYVLRALDPVGRAEVDEHLCDCPACRAELAELAELPRLLATLTLAEAEDGLPAVPPDGYARLLARAESESQTEPSQTESSQSAQSESKSKSKSESRAESKSHATSEPGRFRRPHLRAAHSRRRLAAACVVLLLAAAGAGAVTWQASQPQPRSYAATAGPIRMTVTLTRQVLGTGVDVTVLGLPPGEHCTLVAVARDGTRQTVGTWQATYTGQAWVKGAMSFPESRVAELVLLAASGQQLVTVGV